jgi:hypothetical protein
MGIGIAGETIETDHEITTVPAGETTEERAAKIVEVVVPRDLQVVPQHVVPANTPEIEKSPKIDVPEGAASLRAFPIDQPPLTKVTFDHHSSESGFSKRSKYIDRVASSRIRVSSNKMDVDSQKSQNQQPSNLQDRETNNGDETGEAKEEDEDDDNDELRTMAMMGFGGFDSTKGKHVEGNQSGASKTNKQRTWRQYMNRCVRGISAGHGAVILILFLSSLDVAVLIGQLMSYSKVDCVLTISFPGHSTKSSKMLGAQQCSPSRMLYIAVLCDAVIDGILVSHMVTPCSE